MVAEIILDVGKLQKINATSIIIITVDIHLEVSAVPFNELSAKQPGTSSKSIRDQVAVAREIQQ